MTIWAISPFILSPKVTFLLEKVTGDPNVPCGELTANGSLEDAIELTANDMDTIETLQEAAKETLV